MSTTRIAVASIVAGLCLIIEAGAGEDAVEPASPQKATGAQTAKQAVSTSLKTMTLGDLSPELRERCKRTVYSEDAKRKAREENIVAMFLLHSQEQQPEESRDEFLGRKAQLEVIYLRRVDSKDGSVSRGSRNFMIFRHRVGDVIKLSSGKMYRVPHYLGVCTQLRSPVKERGDAEYDVILAVDLKYNKTKAIEFMEKRADEAQEQLDRALAELAEEEKLAAEKARLAALEEARIHEKVRREHEELERAMSTKAGREAFDRVMQEIIEETGDEELRRLHDSWKQTSELLDD